MRKTSIFLIFLLKIALPTQKVDPEWDLAPEIWLFGRRIIMMKNLPPDANYTIESYYRSWNLDYQMEKAKMDVANFSVKFINSEAQKIFGYSKIFIKLTVSIEKCKNSSNQSEIRLASKSRDVYRNIPLLIWTANWCGTARVIEWCETGKRHRVMLKGNSTSNNAMLFWANVTANCPISTWNRIGLVIEDTWHDFWILQAALLILAVCITFSALYCVYVCRQKYKMHRKEKQRREKLESQRKFEEEIIRKKSSKFANAEEGDSIFGEDNDFISQRSPRSDEYSNTNFVFEVDSKRKMSKFCHDVSKMDAGPEPEPKFSISPIITDEEKERAQTQNSDELDEENGQIQLVFQGETSCRPRRK